MYIYSVFMHNLYICLKQDTKCLHHSQPLGCYIWMYLDRWLPDRENENLHSSILSSFYWILVILGLQSEPLPDGVTLVRLQGFPRLCRQWKHSKSHHRRWVITIYVYGGKKTQCFLILDKKVVYTFFLSVSKENTCGADQRWRYWGTGQQILCSCWFKEGILLHVV